MRRSCAALLCWQVLLGGAIARADDDGSPEARPVEVWKTTEPIAVDGVLDEAVWKKATPVAVHWIWGKTGQQSDRPHMVARFAWDDQHLYIAYETFDANLVALGNGETQGPDGNQRPGASIHHPDQKVDVVEFFLSFGDTRFFWEVHHNALNQFSDIWCAAYDDDWPVAKTAIVRFGIRFCTDEYLHDDPDAGAKFATAARLKAKADGRPSTVNEAGDTDTGYTAELRLPWLGLGAPLAAEHFVTVERDGRKRQYRGPWKMQGQQMRILSVVQNGDLSDHYHHSSPTFPGSWFHKGAVHWPRYVFREASAGE